jgi:c-di-GMP-related signal transduction protein
MKESLERLMKLADRGHLTNSEMNELLRISLFLASWAIEMNAKCVMNQHDRTEMVIVMLSLLTSRIFEDLNIEQRNIIINPSDPDDSISGDLEYLPVAGNC